MKIIRFLHRQKPYWGIRENDSIRFLRSDPYHTLFFRKSTGRGKKYIGKTAIPFNSKV